MQRAVGEDSIFAAPLSHVIDLFLQSVEAHGYRPGEIWTWGSTGSKTETHWGSSAVLLGEEVVNLAAISLQRGFRSEPQMKGALSTSYDLDICLTGKQRTSILFFTFLTDCMKRSSSQNTGFYVTAKNGPIENQLPISA